MKESKEADKQNAQKNQFCPIPLKNPLDIHVDM